MQNVYNQTTVINNIQVNNNVVVNSGVSADRIAVITRSEIRKVAVREAGPQELSLQRLDKLEKSGNDLVIYRPALNPNAPVKPMLFTNNKGESRTELVPAGTTPGAKIVGRPVYDTTSTGVPVLTGYTTEPPVTRGNQNTVVINNHINATPPPAPVISTSPVPPVNPRAVAQPETSTPQNLTPPHPVATYQPTTRTEFKKPQPTSAPPPAPSAPTPSYTAPVAQPRPTTVVPTYTPPPPRPSVQPQPAAPVAVRPTVIVSPPPQPATAPTSNNSSPSKTEQEKKK